MPHAAAGLEREGVLLLARDAVSLGDVLARLAHRLQREQRLQRGFGKRQPSVVSQTVWWPRGNARVGLRQGTSGARLIDSTPPATKRSPSPAGTAWHAVTTAESPDAQRRLTVTPATESGSPASSAAMRATFRLSSPAWFAQPKKTSSISPASRRLVDGGRTTWPRGRPGARPRGRRRSAQPAYAPRRGSTARVTRRNASRRTRRERAAERAELLATPHELGGPPAGPRPRNRWSAR